MTWKRSQSGFTLGYSPWPLSLGILLLGGLLVRGAIAAYLPLGLDEVYYYVYSHHLNWSYFDHPPLVALTTGMGWWLTGVLVPFTVRLGALVLYPLSLILLYLTAQRLYSTATGLLAVAITSIAPLLWITFGLLTAPDNSLIFFWSLALYVAAVEFLPPATTIARGGKATDYQPSWRLAVLGLLLGLAGLSKYHGFVLGAGILGFCLTRGPQRRALFSPWMALAVVLGLAVLAPLGWWNSQNDWISFRFHLGLRFEGGEAAVAEPYRLGDLAVTWLLGIVYLCPTLGLPLWWVTGRGLLNQVRCLLQPPLGPVEFYARDRQALILWASVPIALGMTLIGGQHHTFPAWPAPGFWGLSILLAEGMGHWRPRFRRRWLGGTAAAIATLSLIALLHLTLGILQKPSQYSLLGGFVSPEADGSTILLDIVQLRQRLADRPDLLQAMQSSTFVFTDEFYLAAYVDMAVQPLSNRPVTTFSQDPRGFAFWFNPADWVGADGLFVTLRSFHPNDDPTVPFNPFFEGLEPLGELTLTRGGAPTETLLIYRALTLTQPYSYPY
ncbi:ArnT family glycosyltransferase [Leptolyngbya sp. PCC 6406]|uniref:ArnT family glycosyltransferase n=1 Tax=Leptolyngbya sp. PCC 6406 TaxID=1173264 RepID=UPI0002AC9E08|nr:glycosyltransferase family 39 protein [Leptolyngbya sp. PCC 6406]